MLGECECGSSVSAVCGAVCCMCVWCVCLLWCVCAVSVCGGVSLLCVSTVLVCCVCGVFECAYLSG